MKLMPSGRVLCTPYNHAPCHFTQSHIRKVHACLAVTCYLHFWQNDRDLLRTTAVTRRWNGYRNESQHRKLTLEKIILPPLLQGFETATFRSRVQPSDHWTIPVHPLWMRDPRQSVWLLADWITPCNRGCVIHVCLTDWMLTGLLDGWIDNWMTSNVAKFEYIYDLQSNLFIIL